MNYIEVIELLRGSKLNNKETIIENLVENKARIEQFIQLELKDILEYHRIIINEIKSSNTTNSGDSADSSELSDISSSDLSDLSSSDSLDSDETMIGSPTSPRLIHF
jgi:hypothetical protein